MKTEYIVGAAVIAVVGYYLYKKGVFVRNTGYIGPSQNLSNQLQDTGGALLAQGAGVASGLIAQAGNALSTFLGNTSSGIWNPTETTAGSGNASS